MRCHRRLPLWIDFAAIFSFKPKNKREETKRKKKLFLGFARKNGYTRVSNDHCSKCSFVDRIQGEKKLERLTRTSGC